MDLRLGTWQHALADVECDALIVDAPYSERTHTGHDVGVAGQLADRARYIARNGGSSARGERKALGYDAWTAGDVHTFVERWSPRTKGWMVSLTDHLLAIAWAEAMQAAGRYVFSPVPFVASGSRVRLSGDGPACWSCWIVVARPRSRAFAEWGALPGAYVLPSGENDAKGAANNATKVIGSKPLWLMRALIRDYSRPGDLVCDPCAGGATTLLAAAIEGRRAVGAEMDPETHAKALARLSRGYTPTLFPSTPTPAVQDALF